MGCCAQADKITTKRIKKLTYVYVNIIINIKSETNEAKRDTVVNL